MSKYKKYCLICGTVEDVASFRFPKDSSVRELWLKICNVKEVTNRQKLCAKHFSEEDILKTELRREPGRFRINLKKGAIPLLSLGVPKSRNNFKYVKKCFLCGCTERSLSYFRFPKDIEQKKKWLKFCEFPVDDAINLGCKVFLCENHFTEDDILRKKNIGGIDRLQLNAVPKIYSDDSSCKISNELCGTHHYNTRKLIADSTKASQPICNESEDEDVTAGAPSKTISVQEFAIENISIPNEMDATEEFVLANETFSDDLESGTSAAASIDSSLSEKIFSSNCIECLHCIQHISECPYTNLHNREPDTSYFDGSSDENNSENLSDDFPRNTSTHFSKKRRLAYIGDVTSSDFTSPRRARLSFNLAKAEVLSNRRKIDILQKRMNRMKTIVKRYSTLLKHMNSKNLLSENASLGLFNERPFIKNKQRKDICHFQKAYEQYVAKSQHLRSLCL